MSLTLSSWLSRAWDDFNPTSVYAATVIFAVYYGSKIFYRLYLSPLSSIPGPKIAAATKLYAFYHEVIRRGLYIWEIEAMHEKYGPIIRISPGIVHINDPEYIDLVFGGPGKKREKGQQTINGLASSPTVLGTANHDLHKSRRGAISSFFSKQNIRRLEPTIIDILQLIFQRLDEHNKTRLPLDLGLLFRAATHDIISNYAFGEGSMSLARPDLNEPYFHAYHQMVVTWHIGCYFPWIGRLMRKLPPAAVTVLMPTAKNSIETIEASMVKIDNIRSSLSQDEATRTIFHGLLQSDLPESEKSSVRLAEESQNLLAAGTDSTANTLTVITYHLLSNPAKLQKLQEELRGAVPEGSLPKFSEIENLPYLSAIIQEGLRLHPAVASRQERLAPDEDLIYTDEKNRRTYRIPAGTCLAMNPVLLSRLPDLYPSPQEFRPERFLENPKLKRHQLTFSRGTRICAGINLAYQELFMILAAIFTRYDGWDGTGKQKASTLELFETTRRDIDCMRDLVTEVVPDDSKGVRVVVRGPSNMNA